ncbi:hypothetical protein GCM10027168_09880 [Streptomyces capparidis]
MRPLTRPLAEWEVFLAAPVPPDAVPRLPLRTRVWALAAASRAVLVYRRRGWGAAREVLEGARPGPGARAGHRAGERARVLLARRQVFWTRLLVRVLLPGGECLPRALALAVCLRTLGLPAEVCVGRALAGTRERDGFHAWTELDGTVLGDNQDITVGYRVLQRTGAAPARAGSRERSR